jgi:hypothetical protein
MILAALAFVVCWIMTNGFEDSYARLVLGTTLASWVAIGSAISGFLLAHIEEQAW